MSGIGTRVDLPSDPDGSAVRLDSIADAVIALASGAPIVVVDDADRENEGDMIVAASLATSDIINFMTRYTSGFICVGMEAHTLDRLNIPPMNAVNEDRKGTAYSVTVDARAVEGTGISAEDRAATIRALGDPSSSANSFTRPGRVVPLRAVAGGVLRRPGHTEAAVDLVRMAGLLPAGALCEMVNDDGSMMDAAQCRAFCDQHGLVLASIADLIEYRLAQETLIERVAQASLPLAPGEFRIIGFCSVVDGSEHVALVLGELGDGCDVLTRVQPECVSGDVFASRLCDCRDKLQQSLSTIAAEGRGVLLYVRPQVGQAMGAFEGALGYPHGTDAHSSDLDYGMGAQILRDLGVKTMKLMTSHPEREYHLSGFGLTVSHIVPI